MTVITFVPSFIPAKFEAITLYLFEDNLNALPLSVIELKFVSVAVITRESLAFTNEDAAVCVTLFFVTVKVGAVLSIVNVAELEFPALSVAVIT